MAQLTFIWVKKQGAETWRCLIRKEKNRSRCKTKPAILYRWTLTECRFHLFEFWIVNDSYQRRWKANPTSKKWKRDFHGIAPLLYPHIWFKHRKLSFALIGKEYIIPKIRYNTLWLHIVQHFVSKNLISGPLFSISKRLKFWNFMSFNDNFETIWNGLP